MRTRLILPATLTVLLVAMPVMAQQFSSLEERMSAADFKAAGLDKLTPQQLHFLDKWLRDHGLSKAGAPPVDAHGAAVAHSESDNQPRQKFTAHMVGQFDGWSGHTRFTLANGEVWQQAESGRYYCPEVTNPQVTIKPMILGSWLMYVQGCNQSVRVQRVK